MQLNKITFSCLFFNIFVYVKLILFFLLSFQSIEKQIDSYFDSSDEIFYLLYDEKIEKYSLKSDYKLLSSIEIKYLKLNFWYFFTKIEYKNNKSIPINKYIKRYFDKKPIAAKTPSSAQSS